jgi:hypothetical protein
MADVRVSQLIAQIETQLHEIRVSRLIAQVEYVEVAGAPAVYVSQVLAQIEYTEPPPAPTGPLMAQLMRHGTWFGDGIKQKMWWAR